ncbi:MAG TPA: acylneuraminate cytidylyltransferase family protein [Kofleriaceae bacterium]|nr:acylneuraminate cytidylyltransferase family protein [Kofleriaceae bacterium]
MNVAIVTARAGSKSIRNKNAMSLGGRPMVQYPIQAAQDATRIQEVWVSTDGELIADASRAAGAKIIPRPDELGGDTINHGLVIKHAVEYVDARVDNLENVVLLLGNTVMVDGAVIDRALEILDQRSDLDSVLTVWEAADDHPYRALEITPEGLVTTFGGARKVSTERQSYPKAYYYDQGVWAFRKHTVQSEDGPNPWWWMGKRVYPIVRPWATGRDIHGLIDVHFAQWWLDNPDKVRELGTQHREPGDETAADGKEPAK